MNYNLLILKYAILRAEYQGFFSEKKHLLKHS